LLAGRRTVGASAIWRRWFHRAFWHGYAGDGCRTIADSELAVGVLEVLGNGPRADSQGMGDGGVGAAVSDEPQDLDLALGQPDTGISVASLRESVRGQLLTAGDEGYDQARAVHNGMFDKRPLAVLRAEQVADVIAAVNFARDNGLDLAIRDGGHSAPGFGTNDGGLVIDMSPMHSVHVDPGNKTARADAGTTWGDFNHATHAFGLATTGGIISTTGVTGLTLGGGIGYLARGCGLSIDNLISADVVTAEGRFVTASADENEAGSRVPEVSATMHMYPINGACHRVGPTDTAFAYRDAKYGMVFLASWTDPTKDAERIQWVRDYYQALAPYSEPGGYINFMQDDDYHKIRDNYRQNYDRLVQVKRAYDPSNLFHINQNITP
jgi:FAD/FMN-containing dehydrogenase